MELKCCEIILSTEEWGKGRSEVRSGVGVVWKRLVKVWEIDWERVWVWEVVTWRWRVWWRESVWD